MVAVNVKTSPAFAIPNWSQPHLASLSADLRVYIQVHGIMGGGAASGDGAIPALRIKINSNKTLTKSRELLSTISGPYLPNGSCI